ncbi:MAG: hypothetical protein D3914_00950 [Candidatus Electrothrix sp. LOE2]|nr:hypothetical protein [Candidatus Electrothrix sp. LOE2]
MIQKETVAQIYRPVKTENIFFFNGFGTLLTRKKKGAGYFLPGHKAQGGYYLPAKEKKNSRKGEVFRDLPRYPA